MFSDAVDPSPRCAVRIADSLVDLAQLSVQVADAFSESPISAADAKKALLAADAERIPRTTTTSPPIVSSILAAVLSADSPVFGARNHDLLDRILVPIEKAKLHLAFRSGDYTDFCASVYHCTSTGSAYVQRSARPLEDQWYQLPIAYHGRSSSLVVSGTDFVRPQGIFPHPTGVADIEFGPSRRMDFELEMGLRRRWWH